MKKRMNMPPVVFLKKDILPQLIPGFVWSIYKPGEYTMYSYEVTVKETTVTILNAFKSSYLSCGCPKSYNDDGYDKYLSKKHYQIFYKCFLESSVINYVNSPFKNYGSRY